MADELWETVPIASVSSGIFDGPHATPPKTSKGPVFLGIETLSKGRLDLSVVEHLSEEDFIRWTRRISPQANDLVFSYETRLGEAALIPKGLRCCLGRRMALVRPNTEKINPRYLLYYFLSPKFQAIIRERTIHGSTVDRIALREFPQFPILLPCRRVQEAIAKTLGSLDDKIDLNGEMNRSLEAMARAIFKAWFVDFDPVRERHPRQGRPGRLSHLAALSKDSLNPADCPDEVFEHYSLPAFDESKSPKLEMGKEIKSNKFIVPPGAVLLSKLNPRIPRIWLPQLSGERRAICSTEFLPVLPVQQDEDRYYLYSLFSSSDFLDELASRATGTSGSHQRVRPDDLLRIDCEVPEETARRHYSDVVRPMFHRIALNLEESRTLAALRDALLPKLLSGEIRVKQAEKIVGEAV